MLLSREQKNQLRIRFLKKVLFLIVLTINAALISIAITTSAHAAFPRQFFGDCYYTEADLLAGHQSKWNKSDYAFTNVRYFSNYSYNPTTEAVTYQIRNATNNSLVGTYTVNTIPCMESQKNLFENLPTQDLIFKIAFIFAFLNGIKFGHSWSKF